MQNFLGWVRGSDGGEGRCTVMKKQVPLKTSEWYSISIQFNFRVFVFQPVFLARLLKHISFSFSFFFF